MFWIRQGQQYQNVPNFVSEELCRRTSILPSDMTHLPPPSLPIIQLLNFPTPPVAQSLRGINPKDFFSHNEPTHKSFESLQLAAPSHEILKKFNEIVKASAIQGETMGLSTGLNHHNRWTIKKAAAGSYPLAVGDIMPSGNVANAQVLRRTKLSGLIWLLIMCNYSMCR